MQEAQYAVKHQPADLLMSILRGARSLFTLKRATYAISGALVCVFIIAFSVSNGAIRHQHSVNNRSPSARQSAPTSFVNSSNALPQPVRSSNGISTTDNPGKIVNEYNTTDLTVNGHSINVPKDSRTRQTINNSDGSRTTVSASSSSSQNGSSNNVNIRVESRSKTISSP